MSDAARGKERIYRSVTHADMASLGVEDFPKCDVCNRPVERVDRSDDCRTGLVTFRVFCHGAEEVVELDEAHIARMRGLAFGRAFKRPKALTP